MTENSIMNDPLVLASDKIKRLFGVSSTLDFLQASDEDLIKMFSSVNLTSHGQDIQRDTSANEISSNIVEPAHTEIWDDYKDSDREMMLENRITSNDLVFMIDPSIILVRKTKAYVCSVATGEIKQVLLEDIYPIQEPVHDFFRSFAKELCPSSNGTSNELLKLFLKGKNTPLYFNIQDDPVDNSVFFAFKGRRVPASEIENRSRRFWFKMKCLRDIWTKGIKTQSKENGPSRIRKFNKTIYESDYAKTINIMVSLLPRTLPNGDPKLPEQYLKETKFIIDCFESYKKKVNLKILPYPLDTDAAIEFSKEMSTRFERLEAFSGADEVFRHRMYSWADGYYRMLLDVEEIFESQLNQEVHSLMEAEAIAIKKKDHRKPSDEQVKKAVYSKLTSQLYLSLLDKCEAIYAASSRPKSFMSEL